jgi:uncharacterized protein (TIGR03437 family)
MRSLFLFICIVIFGARAGAQISSNAYRVLGQLNLSGRGLNLVQGVELYSPSAMVLDTRGGQTHIYISDVGNARVLGWVDTGVYQIGDPPGVVLGQPGPNYVNAMGIGNQGFTTPYGLAVDPATGNLYVADSSNNRILRFPSPFSNTTNYSPNAVLGQAGYTTFGTGISSSALNKPESIAFDSAGNLWVADTGNNRVLRFPAAVLDGRSAPQADTVIGQKLFTTNAVNGGAAVSASGLNSPSGIALDSQNNLYVSDFNNARVLKFATLTTNAAATGLYGQTSFTARVISPASNSTMAGPAGLTVSASGTLYVAVPSENRVLAFASGNTASTVYGQSSLTTSSPNISTTPFASANGLLNPEGVQVDVNGNVYIVDTGNNRVLYYAANSRTATNVWGQANFTGNEPNSLKANSIGVPYGMVIDYSQPSFPLYVSDNYNNRILIWKNSVRFISGAPADLVIGQPSLLSGFPNVDTGGATPTSTSLLGPEGLAVDASGNLYVADSGNNRVLRYPTPINQTGRITPDVVLGQPNFTSSATGVVSASSLTAPSAVAVAPGGQVYVADAGANRVLEFSSNLMSGVPALQVFGQPNFNSGTVSSSISGQTLNVPGGLFVDPSYNLYVADTGNNRVLVFSNTQSSEGNGAPASLVYGQAAFNSGAAGNGSAGLRSPSGVAVDTSGNIYVSDYGNNRVVVYPTFVFSKPAGTAATSVIGQSSLSGTAPDWDSSNGLATADSLFEPSGVYLDRNNTLYVADLGNNRVAQFLGAAAVVNDAHFLASVPVAPGSAAALFTADITSQTQVGTIPLSTTLAGLQVVIDDTLLAPLYAVTPGQTNFQVPSATPLGTNRIAIASATTGELLSGTTFSVGSVEPGLFSLASSGSGPGAIFNQDGTINGAANAAPRGTVVSLFGTGQGPISPPVPDGQPAPSLPLAYTVTTPASNAQMCTSSPQAICVAFGNTVLGTVQFSGMAPGWVGLWQINVQIPTNAPTGKAVSVEVVIGANPSNVVTMAIQ